MFDTYKLVKSISKLDSKDDIVRIVEILKGMSVQDVKNFLKILNESKNEKKKDDFNALSSATDYVVVTKNEEDKNLRLSVLNEENDDFTNDAKQQIRQWLIEKLGADYDKNLEKYEPDTANAFKEADYQIARADAVDAELQYYKAINDPNGLKGMQLQHLWERVIEMKKRLDFYNNQ